MKKGKQEETPSDHPVIYKTNNFEKSPEELRQTFDNMKLANLQSIWNINPFKLFKPPRNEFGRSNFHCELINNFSYYFDILSK